MDDKQSDHENGSGDGVPDAEILDDGKYYERAWDLESCIDRMENRYGYEDLVQWFEENDMPITVQTIENKGSAINASYQSLCIVSEDGLGMIAKRPIPNKTEFFVCPPYCCVVYEQRKYDVCAYCFKEFSMSEESRNVATFKKSVEFDGEKDDGGRHFDVDDCTDSCIPENKQYYAYHDALKRNGVTSNYDDLQQLYKCGDTEDVQDEQTQLSSFLSLLTAKETTTLVDEEEEVLPDTSIMCRFCRNVAYCSEECYGLDWQEHCVYECPALQKFDTEAAKRDYNYCDDIITDIRLLVKTVSRRQYQIDHGIYEFQEYNYLISNRNCYSENVVTSLAPVVQHALYLLSDETLISENELMDIYFKNRVNMFGIWGQNEKCLGYGIYPKASYFNHSCWPNTTFYKSSNYKIPHLCFTTIWPIEEAGQEVCISYIDISIDLFKRRNTLLEKYFFHCKCPRCELQENSPQLPDPYYVYWLKPKVPTNENTASPNDTTLPNQ